MPAVLGSVASEGFVVDKSSNTIRFERLLNRPPDDVFAAWTQPQQVQCWWDPSGAPLARCEIDLRIGGSFAFVSQAHPDGPFTGTYRQIERPTRLVFDAFGAEGRVTLRATANGTRMIVEIVCSSPEHLQQFVDMGVAVGTSQTLDNLVAYNGL